MFVRNLNLLSVALSQPLQHGTEAAWQNVCEKFKFAQCCAVATIATWHRGSLAKCLCKIEICSVLHCRNGCDTAQGQHPKMFLRNLNVLSLVLLQLLQHGTEAAS
jgi:hypothetical protein